MNFRKLGFLVTGFAGALALGACAQTSPPPGAAFSNTKVSSLPAAKAPSTLPAPGGPKAASTPPLANTKAAKLAYGSAPWTLPRGRRLRGRDISVAFRGRRTVFTTPNGSQKVSFGTHTMTYDRASGEPMVGHWRVRGNQMCVKWPRRAESCYEVYTQGANGYTVWHMNHLRGRISLD